jgi:hypothetical protein
MAATKTAWEGAMSRWLYAFDERHHFRQSSRKLNTIGGKHDS